MSKVNSILNYLKSYQDGIEGLRHNVPGFTFSGFTFTVNTETISGVEKQVIDVFGIVNNDLDNKSMEAINLTVPSLKQSVSRISTTNYASIIKERNSPIYYNRKIEIVTDNNPVDNDMELVQDENGSATSGTSNQLISDDLPEMGIYTTSTNVYYRVKSIYPDWSKDSADEQLEGNNEVSGDEVAHDSGHDLTEQEAKEILDNMLGKNEEFNALTDVLDKLFKAGTFPEDQPKTLKELIDKLQDENGTTEDSEGKQNVILKLPEENITLNDGIGEYHYDIHFVSTMTDGPEKVTSIDIGGATTNNSKFFQKGHKVILSIRFENLTVDITTAVIDEVTEDSDGVRLFVTEQLPTPSPVKDEREGAELSSEGIKSNNPDGKVNSDPNLSNDKHSNRPPRSQYNDLEGEPGVEGMKTTIKVGNGNSSIVSDGGTITLNGDKITLNGEEVSKADHLVLKGVKITLGDITLNADELVFDGHINLNEATEED